MKHVLSFLILLYQYTLGLILPPRCRFYPSCSQYARLALAQHSVAMAVWLILKRLLKCHPFHPGGIDEVPLSHVDKDPAE